MSLTTTETDARPADSDERIRFTLLTPTGHLTIANYLGALQSLSDPGGTSYAGISDLHAMTMPHRPDALRRRIAEFQRLVLACGLDPSRHILFRQSAVTEHTSLHYLLECVARVGELGRMIQFKEKGRGNGETRASLFSYPVLMAADILLYRAGEVPVGDDQSQHVELARDLAQRFNRDYPGEDGPVFVVPRTVNPVVAARVMDLQRPTIKMSKSATEASGVIYLLDPPDVVRRKIRRAVTDSLPGLEYRPDVRPGLANLLELGAACSGEPIQQLVDRHRGFGDLKATVTDAVIAVQEPIQRRCAELDDDEVTAIFADGADRARIAAAPTLAAARKAIGL